MHQKFIRTDGLGDASCLTGDSDQTGFAALVALRGHSLHSHIRYLTLYDRMPAFRRCALKWQKNVQ